MAFNSFLLWINIKIIDRISTRHVEIAVKSGPKLAFPNGIISKYEYVFLISSLDSVIEINTAPYGKASNTIAIMGAITNNNRFLVFINKFSPYSVQLQITCITPNLIIS